MGTSRLYNRRSIPRNFPADKRHAPRILAAIAIAIGLAPFAAGADDADFQAFVRDTLREARTRHGVPAIAALVRAGGRDTAAAVGVRAVGEPAPVTVDDRWHIGSDTKAFTATLIARLVEEGVLRFDETLEEALPEAAPGMHPGYRGVTILQLLSHTGGIASLTSDKDLPASLSPPSAG